MTIKHHRQGDLITKANEKYRSGDQINLDLSMELAKTKLENQPEGFFAGIASTPSVDLYGHKVLKGAFDKSIRQKGLTGPRGIKLLAYHDWSKPAGVISKLKTVGDNLEIEGQLNLNVSYVKDVHEVALQNGGLNFSVGFALDEFSYVDEEKSEDGEYLLIKTGELMEVSVVVFPAQLEAEMTFIKNHDTMSQLEKALVANGLCRGRRDAHKLANYLKANSHLFLDRQQPSVEQPGDEHPLLDVQLLQPVRDQLARIKAML
jgi:HK97 family phage prohead protease